MMDIDFYGLIHFALFLFFLFSESDNKLDGDVDTDENKDTNNIKR